MPGRSSGARGVIPRKSEDLDTLLAEIERQEHEVVDLFQDVSAEGAIWRPDETRWSMTGHIAHLGIVNDAYLDAIEESLERVREDGGQSSEGPYRHPWLARRFARLLEPPPGLRVKTFRAMVPEPDVRPEEAVETFRSLLRRLGAAVEESRGLDLGAVRFGSPFFKLVRLSLGTGFEVVLAHDRRHVWLIRELMESEGFPG